MSRVLFVYPVLLVLIPLALVAAVVWRRWLGGALTLATVLCLVVALARPQWATEVRRTARVYALDTSGSMFLDTPKALAALRRSMAELAPDDLVGLVAFGASAATVLPPTSPRLLADRLAPPAELPRPDGTDIAEALRVAARQLPPAGYDRQVVLLSDGRETAGNAELEAALAADGGVRVLAIPVGPAEVADARVALLRAPARVRVGEPFSLEAELASTAHIEATLAITRDGAEAAPPRRVALEPGIPRRVALADKFTAPGLHRYAASLLVADRCAENNTAEAIVRAEGATRVLYLAPGKPALAQVLAAQAGIDVTPLGPGSPQALGTALAGADCLVLEGVPAAELPAPAQQAIRDWVRDTGAGLIALGGPAAYGPGGYAGTPIEEALPVLCVRPQKLALLVALDRSGSMADAVKGRTKIACAREAVLACVAALREGDSFGLLAFAAEPQSVVPLGPRPDPERLAQQLQAIAPHGPTELAPALEQALRQLAEATAQLRHVILVSDGQVTDAQAEALRAAAFRKRFADAAVSVSALMTGRDDKAAALLADIAGPGFRPIEDPADLRGEFLEALRQTTNRAFIQTGRTPVRPGARLMLAEGIAPGHLQGYVRTVAKPTAATEWLAGNPPDPILARWQFGLGRAVAFASTVGTEWDQALWAGDALGRLWAQAVRWAARPPAVPGFEAEVVEHGDQMQVTVRAERDGSYLNGLDLTARIAPPTLGPPAVAGEARPGSPPGGPQEVALRQTAPGEYQATFAAPIRGPYHVTIIERGAAPGGPRGGSLLLTVSAVRSYSREWEAFGVDRAALAAIARSGRGELLTSLDDLARVAPGRAAGHMDVDWVFCLTALALFVADVAHRVARARRMRL